MEQPVLLSTEQIQEFGFSGQPFDRIASGFTFEDDGHTTQINIMVHMLQTSEQVIFVRGEAGLGKSTLLQRVAGVPTENLAFCGVKIVPNVSSDGLFQAVLSAYQLDPGQGNDLAEHFISQMVQMLQNGQQAALLIDDANLLNRAAVAKIVEARQQIFNTIGSTFGLVFAASPALDNTLASIVHADYLHVVNLRPYTLPQTIAYLRACFRTVGVDVDAVFSKEEIENLHAVAQGNVSSLQIAVSNYLDGRMVEGATAEALVEEAPQVDDLQPDAPIEEENIPVSYPEDDDEEQVNISVEGQDELTHHHDDADSTKQIPWLYVGVGVAVVALAGVLIALMQFAGPGDEAETVEVVLEPVKPVVEAPEKMVSLPAKQPEEESENVTPQPAKESEQTTVVEDDGQPKVEPELAESALVESETPKASEPTDSKPVVEDTNANEAVDKGLPAPEETVEEKPEPQVVVKPEPKPIQKVEPKPAVASESSATSKKPDAAKSSASQVWLSKQPAKHYTIQLVGANNPKNLDDLAKPYAFKMRTPHVFKTDLKGKDWYIMVTGSYKTKEDAKKAIAGLPKAIKAYKPWVRSFGSIKVKP